MDIKILIVGEKKQWFKDFLEKRGLTVVDEGPTVIHYFNKNSRLLMKLLKKWEPELVVIHSKQLRVGTKATSHLVAKIHNWIIEPIETFSDIIKNTQIWTDNPQLAKIYYQHLNLQREIVEVKYHKKRTLFHPNLGHIIDWSRISRFMYWD